LSFLSDHSLPKKKHASSDSDSEDDKKKKKKMNKGKSKEKTNRARSKSPSSESLTSCSTDKSRKHKMKKRRLESLEKNGSSFSSSSVHKAGSIEEGRQMFGWIIDPVSLEDFFRLVDCHYEIFF
jgi:hypothetical protein